MQPEPPVFYWSHRKGATNHHHTMTFNEYLTSRIGKRVTAYIPMTHGNAMITGILSQSATGWEIGNDPVNSMTFKEDMIEDRQGNVIFMHYHKL